MVDLQQIKELIQLMVDNDLAEVSLRDGTEEVNLKRAGVSNPVVASAPMSMQVAPPPVGPVAALPQVEVSPRDEAAEPEEDVELVAIKSPMVGTFYGSPSPDAPAYVKIGDQISPGNVVCIVEAMKVFNEIKAEVSGTIAKILVSNEAAIEYGQELFLVRPN